MISEKDYVDLKEIFKLLERRNERELEEISELIDDVIKYKIKDEDTISRVFDRMLDLVFVDEDDIKNIYYRLLNYTKQFNKGLSADYENIFIEQFSEIDDDDFILRKHQLDTYYEIGKKVNCQIQTINEKTLDECLQEYIKNIDNKYTIEELKDCVKFYRLISCGVNISYEITWDDYKDLLLLEDENLINYYIMAINSGKHSINDVRKKWRKEEKYKNALK